MPVYKFKSLREAEEALWCLNPDQEYYDSIGESWPSRTGIKCLPGIWKFKTIEEANKHMDELLLEQALQQWQCRRTRVSPSRTGGKSKQR